jgi:glycine cleavage system regulatory protein
VVVERAAPAAPPASPTRLLRVELVGNDRPGLIRDVSSALADRGINVEELATEVTDAPMAGGMLLKVTAHVRAARELSADSLRQELEARANDFLVDIAVAAEPGDPS